MLFIKTGGRADSSACFFGMKEGVCCFIHMSAQKKHLLSQMPDRHSGREIRTLDTTGMNRML